MKQGRSHFCFFTPLFTISTRWHTISVLFSFPRYPKIYFSLSLPLSISLFLSPPPSSCPSRLPTFWEAMAHTSTPMPSVQNSGRSMLLPSRRNAVSQPSSGLWVSPSRAERCQPWGSACCPDAAAEPLQGPASKGATLLLPPYLHRHTEMPWLERKWMVLLECPTI